MNWIEAKKLKEDQVQVVLDELDTSPSNTQPAHHEMYKKHFNGIDLHDNCFTVILSKSWSGSG